MLCLTADGDVTVRTLMEAILFWQSSDDLFAWEDTDEQKDGGMTHRSTVNRLHLAVRTQGCQKTPFVSAILEPLCACVHVRPQQTDLHADRFCYTLRRTSSGI